MRLLLGSSACGGRRSSTRTGPEEPQRRLDGEQAYVMGLHFAYMHILHMPSEALSRLLEDCGYGIMVITVLFHQVPFFL